jgi:hypothetical protein
MGKKRALFVAVNDYGGAANDLGSAVSDAAALERKVKSDLDFGEILSLYDANATAHNVAAALDWLVRGVEDDDRLLLFYSGHGAQMPVGGVMEERLVLCDGSFPDAQLIAKSGSLPPGVLAVVLDCCFSCGTARIFEPMGDALVRQKWWIPDRDALSRCIDAWPAITEYKPFGCAPIKTSWPPVPAPSPAMPKTWGVQEGGRLEINGLLIAACSNHDTAAAGAPVTAGLSAFTFAFLDVLGRLGPSATSRELLDEVDRKLKVMGFRQTPICKEPRRPGNLAARSFLSLPAVARPQSPTAAVRRRENAVALAAKIAQEMMNRQTQQQGPLTSDDAVAILALLRVALATIDAAAKGPPTDAVENDIENIVQVALIAIERLGLHVPEGP